MEQNSRVSLKKLSLCHKLWFKGKGKEIRQFEFVANTQFLWADFYKTAFMTLYFIHSDTCKFRALIFFRKTKILECSRCDRGFINMGVNLVKRHNVKQPSVKRKNSYKTTTKEQATNGQLWAIRCEHRGIYYCKHTHSSK